MRKRSLRRRIAVAFIALAIFTGSLGGLLAVLFAYSTEDHIFDRLLTLEVENLRSEFAAGSPLPTPELPFAAYYHDEAVPDFLRDPLLEEPGRKEVFGADGRHYHLRRVDPGDGGAPVWVVLEVEDYLVVRPAFSGITAFLGFLIMLITLGAAVASLLIAYRVTAPLRSLADEVEALEPGELPDDWAGRYPADEVGSLADALRNAFRRIGRFIDREQRFTQDASHELRTPLTVIESSASMLARAPGSESNEALVGRIQSAALAMHQSVDALLALARESDPALEGQPSAVLPIVERTVVNHATLLEGKAVEVAVNVDPGWCVTGDPAALQVLIANLVSNAFRYTQEGEIRIERDGEDLLVIDSGTGIEKEIEADVTRPSVKGRNSPGMGLGLSIVDRICERYGWRFDLTSTPEGTTARLGLG